VSLIVRYFTVGGLERVVLALASGLADRGIDVQIVVLGLARRNILITEVDPRVGLVVISGRGVARRRKLSRAVRGRVAHLHFGDGRVHPVLRLALRGASRRVVTYHSDYRLRRNLWTNFLDRLSSGGMDVIIAVSSSVAEFCSEVVGLNRARLKVVSNAVPPKSAKVEWRPQRGVMAALANFYPHKNHRMLIHGLAHLREVSTIPWRLLLIGDGPDVADCFTLSRQLGMSDHIEWLGNVTDRSYVAEKLASAEIFVSASRAEGMPLSILEAAQIGVPLVLSAIPAHRELATDGARYFDPDDPRSLADAVLAVTADGVLRDFSMRSVAIGRASDFEAFIDGHLDAYGFVS
jgi:glycosyltransferase involved in cell wall biosynthesis